MRPKSRFLAQNVRFPAWVGAISRRGIERSNRERLSRVRPRSFGPMVNFLVKSKISKILGLEICSKIGCDCTSERFPKPTCVLWPRYWRWAKFCDTSCLKKFCLPKYAIAAKIKHAGFRDLGKIPDFLVFSRIPRGTQVAPSVAKSIFEPGFGKSD